MSTQIDKSNVVVDVTTLTTLTVDASTVNSGVFSVARGNYASIEFVTFKPVAGDEVIAMTPESETKTLNNDWSATVGSLGVFEVRLYYVPIFGHTGTPSTESGGIAYYVADGKFYKANDATNVGAAPDSTWDEMSADPTIVEFETAIVEQNELYYAHTYAYLADEIENALTDLLLAIKKACHTTCTFNNYELLRRKYEAAKAYFDLENYSKTQELYEDIYNHINSNSCC